MEDKNKNSVNKKRMGFFLTFLLILGAAERILNAYLHHSERVNNTSSTVAIDQKLAQSSPLVPKMHLTNSCQNMQKPILIQNGVGADQVDAVSLPICTCISSALSKDSQFSKMEKMAKDGIVFLEILAKFKTPMVAAMNKCAK